MYTGKISLTNPNGLPFALSNEFNDIAMLKMDVEECKDQGAVIDVVNKNSKYEHWCFKRVSKAKLVLYSKDRCGNIKYLILHKS